MSVFAKIENGVAVEYPLYEGQLEERFPNLQFPMDVNNTPVPDGYVRVTPRDIANYDYSMSYSEGMPVQEGESWIQQWVATPLTAEERLHQETMICSQVRMKRDRLLKESDALVMIDRWDGYTAEKKSAIADYRQALRDVTNQPGFPFAVVFPILTI